MPHGKADDFPAPPAGTDRPLARPSHAERPGASVLTGTVLTDLLRGQVRDEPDGIAVIHGWRSLTYQGLADRAARLAGRLRGLGVAADDCVGLFAEPSFGMMIGVWGILFAGAAYLPIAPDYPEERIRYMIEDSRTSIIVTRARDRDRLAELAPPGIQLVTVEESLESEPLTGAGPRPHDLAYVIYTSGSSGRPKGVMIEHRSIVNQMRWLHEVHRLDRQRLVLHKTPMSFDAAQWEILASACGSRVVVAGAGAHGDPERLIALIRRQGVTTLQCVPTLLQALLDAEGLDRCTSLTEIFSGGEALSRSLAARCQAALPGCRLVNLYGPTECTINTSSWTVDRATAAEGAPMVPIGRPAYGTRYHILDDRLAEVGAGEIGELCVSGVQLARGYLHRPGLTAERFLSNPFADAAGHDRLYRTGDLASRTTDGTVHFVGRTDNQVKLRGFRVELDEIRLAIENHEWVRTAAVVVRDDRRTRAPNLIAFIELYPKDGRVSDQRVAATRMMEDPAHVGEPPELIRDDLRTFLPHHMMPDKIVLLDRLPLTANGKIDSAALAAWEPPADTPGRTAVPARTVTEERIGRIWRIALRRDAVSVRDDFFECGGDSLTAARIVKRINEEFGSALRVHVLVEAPTVEELARRVDAGGAGRQSEQPAATLPASGWRS